MVRWIWIFGLVCKCMLDLDFWIGLNGKMDLDFWIGM